jgi:hypothetical protein
MTIQSNPSFWPQAQRGGGILAAALGLALMSQGCATRGNSVAEEYRLQRQARLEAANAAIQAKWDQDAARLRALRAPAPSAVPMPPTFVEEARVPVSKPKPIPPRARIQAPAAEDSVIQPGEELLRIKSDFSGMIYVDGSKEGKIRRSAGKSMDVPNLEIGRHRVVLIIAGGTAIPASVTIQEGSDAYVYFQIPQARTGASMKQVGLEPGE